MITQIYEIGNPTEAREVAEAGADHIGVLVGNGEFPREISIESAKEILKAISGNCKRVVLTLSGDMKVIENIAGELQPDILHFAATPEAIKPQNIIGLKLKFPQIKMMRTIPVVGEESIEMAQQYDGAADFLLLDSYHPQDKQVGATGITHDWNISKRIVDVVRIPVILAGGLGPENVTEAMKKVHPAGVDSKTKTDKEGTHEKDITKVRAFVKEAKRYGAQAF
jgi:phosphoribosylanthranilate isomerase